MAGKLGMTSNDVLSRGQAGDQPDPLLCYTALRSSRGSHVSS